MRFILWHFILDNPASSTHLRLCKSLIYEAFLCFLSKSEILFFFGPLCFSAKIESHFTLNYATLVNQDVNRKSIYVSCFSWNPL